VADVGGELRELHEKYVAMLGMRRRHQAGEEDVGKVRWEMAELAARYPGALREIDDLPMEVIERRIAGLAAAIEGTGEVAPWMRASARFHVLARGALSAKRWLGGRKHVDAAVERSFASEVGSLPFPDEARAWAGELGELASPPRGRLTDAVLARVGRELDMTARSARRLVFGVPRRERKVGSS
jgi:hypothetical protein